MHPLPKSHPAKVFRGNALSYRVAPRSKGPSTYTVAARRFFSKEARKEQIYKLFLSETIEGDRQKMYTALWKLRLSIILADGQRWTECGLMNGCFEWSLHKPESRPCRDLSIR